jgi:hypothetical protein
MNTTRWGKRSWYEETGDVSPLAGVDNRLKKEKETSPTKKSAKFPFKKIISAWLLIEQLESFGGQYDFSSPVLSPSFFS